MGGIGYTTVYPIERLLRDGRLSMIWTGSNEIMNLLIQHEYYKELNAKAGQARHIEQDAVTPCPSRGASTIAGTDGSRFPSENELAGAKYQGEHVAKIAKKLST